MTCFICWKEEGETKHLPLYINGSEGIDLCHDCEMAVVEYLRTMRLIAGRSRMDGWKAHQKIDQIRRLGS